MVPSFEVGNGREARRYADGRRVNRGLLLGSQPITAKHNNNNRRCTTVFAISTVDPSAKFVKIRFSNTSIIRLLFTKLVWTRAHVLQPFYRSELHHYDFS